MVLEDYLEEVEIFEEDNIPILAKYKDEFYLISLDNNVNGVEIDTLSGKTYCKKLNDEIYFNCAIFLGEKVPEKFREIVLFHEIVESIYMRFGSEQPKAHEYAKKLEQQYAEMFLDNPDEFFEWIKEIRRQENGNLFDSY